MEYAAVMRFKTPWEKLASGLYVPPLLRLGHWYHGTGGRCCCRCHCAGTPQSWQVVIANFSNDDCGDCGNLNDTYIVDNLFLHSYDVAAFDDCIWYYSLPAPICGIEMVELHAKQKEIAPGDWFRIIQVWLHDTPIEDFPSVGANYYWWYKKYSLITGEPIPCSIQDDVLLDTANEEGLEATCDFSLATCRVTAL